MIKNLLRKILVRGNFNLQMRNWKNLLKISSNNLCSKTEIIVEGEKKKEFIFSFEEKEKKESPHKKLSNKFIDDEQVEPSLDEKFVKSKNEDNFSDFLKNLTFDNDHIYQVIEI